VTTNNIINLIVDNEAKKANLSALASLTIGVKYEIKYTDDDVTLVKITTLVNETVSGVAHIMVEHKKE